MSDGLNRVTLIGNLGAAPELAYTQSKKPVLKCRLATSSSYYDETRQERIEQTEWHNVIVWGKRGEALAKILDKGGRLCVEGGLKTRKYHSEKHGCEMYVTEVVATNVLLLGTGKRAASAPAGADDAASDGGNDEQRDHDIPF